MKCFPARLLSYQGELEARAPAAPEDSMGECLSSAVLDDDLYIQETACPLSFHPYVKGKWIELDESLCQAQRCSTWHDGLVFTNRPLRVHEMLSLRVTQTEERWEGSLRVGLTSLDPACIDPEALPPVLCPDLSSLCGFWAALLPDRCGAKGTLVRIWFDRSGTVRCRINLEPSMVLMKGIPARCRLWAVVDVYGSAKAVHLLGQSHRAWLPQKEVSGSSSLGPTAPTSTVPAYRQIYPEDQPGDCVVCLSSKVQAVISPCGHACLCDSCVQRLLQDSAKCPMCRQEIQDVMRHLPCDSGTAGSQGPS
ncbi:E3 ubiquitin-protein ligase NEURL3 [Ambystoma mexicanum]|uniref:E3 ubiquitin-protein ligase NEURL3 n=1 Tax=Ambystoma mexicanum TaxID=8296 RepID=UPI0037E790CA